MTIIQFAARNNNAFFHGIDRGTEKVEAKALAIITLQNKSAIVPDQQTGKLVIDLRGVLHRPSGAGEQLLADIP